jgi:hypothetical protein
MADDRLIEDYDSIDTSSMDINTFVERGSVIFKTAVDDLSNYLFAKLSSIESAYPTICGLEVYPSYIEDNSYVTITPLVSGFPELNYEWIFKYNTISNEKVLIIDSFNINNVGNYYLKVSNIFGEAISETIYLSSNPPTQEVAANTAPKLVSFLTYPLYVDKFEVNDSITFDVVVKNITDSTYYEWYKNGELFTTTKKNYFKIDFLQQGDLASYYVKIYSDNGIITSNTIDLNYEVTSQKVLNRCIGFPVKSLINNYVGWTLTEPVTVHYDGEIGLRNCDLSVSDFSEFYVSDLTIQ